MSAFSFNEIKPENVVDQSLASVQVGEVAGKVVGLYFAAQAHLPSRQFTPKLAKKYSEIVGAGHAFEIIFVSLDDDEEDAVKLYGEMPWKMLAFHDRETTSALVNKFSLESVPALVLIDESGDTLSCSGLECVMQAPFESWRDWEANRVEEEARAARELTELRSSFKLLPYLSQTKLVNSEGQTVSVENLQGKIVGLYFSAHWCPPCRRFTPLLAEKYNAFVQAGEAFEVVFVSSDHDQESAKSYHESMPWPMLEYADRARQTQLMEVFNVEGIPSLILMDDGGIITRDGREAILACSSLEKIRDYEEDKRKEEARLDALAQLMPDEVLSPDHPHPLTKLASIYGGCYGCDICEESGERWVYHCEECGWDAHPACVQTSLIA